MATVLSDGSDFSQALATWRDINLSTLQKSLDTSGLEIVENQKDSLMGRKKLAEQTRDFKKMPDQEKVGGFKGLLKAYQAEIDALTKRSKTSESAFLNIYKLLAEAPDPYPLLEAAVDQTVRASEAKLLESELTRANDQIKSLKSQLKDTEKVEKELQKQTEKLEKLENKLEEMVKLQVSTKEAELDAVYGERIMNFQQREKDLTKQVDLTKKQLADLRMSNESNQAKILDDSSRREFETVSRRAEIELVELDLERSQRRNEEVERRNEKLRAEIEAVRSGSEAQERIQTLESQITELQSETTRLLSTLETQKNTIDEYQEQRSKIEIEYNRQTKKLDQEIQTLKEKVSQFSDYDEIKRELEIIKYVEFASLDPEDEENGGCDDCSPDSSSLNIAIKMPNPNAEKANKQKTKSLETLLISKNRKLQDDLTTLRVMHDELLVSSRMNTIENEKLKSELEKLKSLNESLENDLSRIQASSTQTSQPTNTTEAHVSSQDELNRGSQQEKEKGTQRGIGRSLPSSIQQQDPSTTHRMTSDTSILPIITSQRDRFRQRNSELEEELRKQFETISNTRNEMKSLQNDNLKLYEKVRYLQSYRDHTTTSASNDHSSRFNRFNSSSASSVHHDTVSRKDEELSKYRGIYEEHMNPFEKFRGRERMGALQALNPLDKLVLHTANFVLGNRLTRNLFLIYVLILHFLLFFTYGESAWRSDDLQQSTLRPPIPIKNSMPS
ncbi:hypothetical protein Pst134EA_022819 [Puccinia striiformis f. sp. tritici]|uniref:hypothetical protein n=1 Tax=Puccinia striiformis f. sp. tritici TaxID=168172 RepID=UPI0020082E9B|nr:hypothetical protein Pst134EA_022819 [Puccinia striiformis f. sp. tritici]KAH9455349.1 hypothetical protein Pst134EA_022819 [Puccinia striiformis f. sp. tritici]KAI9612294.1 hypothetical protein KEM48_004310 [Puccinia striiformis f. sp. tritici PST-130]